ncbi:MAG: hypothetical protein WAO83_21140 [Fuerstiella sp.]
MLFRLRHHDFPEAAAAQCMLFLFLLLLCEACVASAAMADVGDQKSTSDPNGYATGEVITPVMYAVTEPDGIFHDQTPATMFVPPADDVGTYVLPPIELETFHDGEYVDGPAIESHPSHNLNNVPAEEFSIEKSDSDEKDKKRKKPRLHFYSTAGEPYKAYRSYQANMNWIPGSARNFGLLEWQTDPYLDRDENSGFTCAMNITWLTGPTTTYLSPRVYDLSIGYQTRQQWTPLFSYDLTTSIGVFSDFEGSARDGVRFPSHAVGMLHINPAADLVFGADFLDRDDISVLPVFGMSIHSQRFPLLRMDLIFPRPRIEYTLSDSKRMYLAGSLGGGTWDVDNGIDLVATYRDYRLVLGFETADSDGETSALEFGYVFGRRLELRGQRDHTDFDDAFMLRWVSRH